MVEKILKKDGKKSHFNNRIEFRKKSNGAIQRIKPWDQKMAHSLKKALK